MTDKLPEIGKIYKYRHFDVTKDVLIQKIKSGYGYDSDCSYILVLDLDTRKRETIKFSNRHLGRFEELPDQEELPWQEELPDQEELPWQEELPDQEYASKSIWKSIDKLPELETRILLKEGCNITLAYINGPTIYSHHASPFKRYNVEIKAINLSYNMQWCTLSEYINHQESLEKRIEKLEQLIKYV